MADWDSHLSLFNDERYLRCNLRPGQRLFRYDHLIDGQLVGTCSGVVEDAVLEGGYSAPFGGIDWVRAREAPSVVVDLFRALAACARNEGVREIRFRGRPDYFGANEAAVQFALLNLGARIVCCELSLGLEAWRYRTVQEYQAALAGSAPHTLRHGLRSEFEFGAAESTSEWAECHALLAEARRRRGAQLRISSDYVLRLREVFGERIAMHRLKKAGETAGAALVYRVTPYWDYVVAWGDDLRHRHDKVMNVMAYWLMRSAIAAQVRIIDLGISSVNGVPDDGLVHFKRSIGGVTGLRHNLSLPTSAVSTEAIACRPAKGRQ